LSQTLFLLFFYPQFEKKERKILDSRDRERKLLFTPIQAMKKIVILVLLSFF
jgi:hypothetical protein